MIPGNWLRAILKCVCCGSPCNDNIVDEHGDRTCPGGVLQTLHASFSGITLIADSITSANSGGGSAFPEFEDLDFNKAVTLNALPPDPGGCAVFYFGYMATGHLSDTDTFDPDTGKRLIWDIDFYANAIFGGGGVGLRIGAIAPSIYVNGVTIFAGDGTPDRTVKCERGTPRTFAGYGYPEAINDGGELIAGYGGTGTLAA